MIENLVDRGDRDRPAYFHCEDHGPLWRMPDVVTLAAVAGCASSTFAQCSFGSPEQKYTTFLYTPGLRPMLSGLDERGCKHGAGGHAKQAGGLKDAEGEWNSADYAAFPPELNYNLTQVLARLVAQHAGGFFLDKPTEAAAIAGDSSRRGGTQLPGAAPPLCLESRAADETTTKDPSPYLEAPTPAPDVLALPAPPASGDAIASLASDDPTVSTESERTDVWALKSRCLETPWLTHSFAA